MRSCASLVKLFLFPAAISCVQGCATQWVVTDYGKTEERFYLSNSRGPVFGDTTRLYILGKKTVEPNVLFQSKRQFPAYTLIDLKDGEIISKEVNDGYLPAVAFEYPEIKRLLPDEDCVWWGQERFVESGQDMAFDWRCVYMKNPRDPNNPYAIGITTDQTYPRSTLSMIALPVVFVGAVAADVVLVSVRILLTPLCILTGAH